MDFSNNIAELNKFDFVDATPLEIQEYYKYTDYNEKDYGYSYINHYTTVKITAKKVILSWKLFNNCVVSKPIVYLSEKEDMSDFVSYDSDMYFCIIQNLLTSKKYYWQVEFLLSDNSVFKSEIAEFFTLPGRRIIYLDGVENVRDIGGIVNQTGNRIYQSLLYRSGEMDSEHIISDEGIKIANNVLKIKTDIDLRKTEEINKDSIEPVVSPLGVQVSYHHFSVNEYSDFLLCNGENEENVFHLFADYNNFPIILHCKYGADRTGTVAFILEALLGVSENQLTMDYELTQWRQRCYEKYKLLVNNFKKIKGENFQEKAYYFLIEILKLSEMEISNIYNIFLTNCAIFTFSSLHTFNYEENDQYSFDLSMRNSENIEKIEYNGETLDFKFYNNQRCTFKACRIKNVIGQIFFNDGSILKFTL